MQVAPSAIEPAGSWHWPLRQSRPVQQPAGPPQASPTAPQAQWWLVASQWSSGVVPAQQSTPDRQ
jgi:hypothetical protein